MTSHRRILGAFACAMLVFPALAQDRRADTVDTRTPSSAASDQSSGAQLSEEWRLANDDHIRVAAGLASCRDSADFRSAAGRAVYRIPFDVYQTSHGTPPIVQAKAELPATASDAEHSGSSSGAFERLDAYGGAVVTLSSAIAAKRVQLASAAKDAYWKMQTFEWVLVGLGAATTLLVSLKSMTDPPIARWSTGIGIAALAFSATATAGATLNSFYHPRAIYLKDQHVLANLRRMHNDIAITAALRPRQDGRCSTIENDDDHGLKGNLSNWATSLQVIIAPEVQTDVDPEN